MTILLAAGERVPVDGRVLKGRSDLDCSLVSGESIPQPVGAGSAASGRHAQPDGPAHDRRHRRREGLVPGRDDADDGGGGIRTLDVPAHRRPRSPALRSRRPPDRRGDIHRLGRSQPETSTGRSPSPSRSSSSRAPARSASPFPWCRSLPRGACSSRASWSRMAARSNASPKSTPSSSTRPAPSRSATPQLVDGSAIDPDALALAAAIASHSRHPYSLRAGRRRPSTRRRADRAGSRVRTSRLGTGSFDRRERVSARPTRMGACGRRVDACRSRRQQSSC